MKKPIFLLQSLGTGVATAAVSFAFAFAPRLSCDRRNILYASNGPRNCFA